MTEQELEETILIGEFIGLIRKEPNGYFSICQWWGTTKSDKSEVFVGYDQQLNFKTWEKLMAIIEKIEKLEFPFNKRPQIAINTTFTGISIADWYYSIEGYEIENKVIGVYRAIVLFLQWYKNYLVDNSKNIKK